jgi:hypothetical protein
LQTLFLSGIIRIENPHLKKEEIEDKYSILDIKATANDEIYTKYC